MKRTEVFGKDRILTRIPSNKRCYGNSEIKESDDENWKKRNEQEGIWEFDSLFTWHKWNKWNRSTTRKVKVQNEWIEHFGEKFKKATMEEEKTLEKISVWKVFFLAGRRKERMVRDLNEGETWNGKTMKLYWVTSKVTQEVCVRRNKRKGKRE